MANYPHWVMQITLQDGVGRDSVMAFYVPEATAKLYFAAADKAARDATAIGVLFGKILAVTECQEVARRVYVEDLTSPLSALDDDILRGNKIVVHAQAGADPLTFTVPGRDATSYTQNSDKVTIDISAAGDFKTFYEGVQSVCISRHGESINVLAANLND